MGFSEAFVTDLSVLFDEWRPHDAHDARVQQACVDQLTRLRAGDASAFDDLILNLSGALESYARRFTSTSESARDIVQDVFAHLWIQRETLQIRGSLRAYLYTAVRNRAFDVRKSIDAEERRLATSDSSAPIGMGERTDAPDVILHRYEIEARVQAALDTLAPRTREAALLRWRDGLSRGEIAAIMGVAVPTVNNQLTAAARVMRALLLDLRNSS